MTPELIQNAIDQLLPHGSMQSLSSADVLLRDGGSARGLYLIIQGQLTTYQVDPELLTRRPLAQLGWGHLAGLSSILKGASEELIQADNDVEVCHFSRDCVSELISGKHEASEHYIVLLQHTLMALSVAPANDIDELRSPLVDALVQRSVVAQQSLLAISENKLDALIADIADAVNRQAWELADSAIKETGMGVLAHRVQKILLGTMEVAASLAGKPGSGALQIESPTVDRVSVPMGVVLGLIPVTNPVETLVFKTLISLKSRNAVVLSCHRKARGVSGQTVSIIKDVLRRYQVNPDLVQIPEQAPRRALTSLLMSHPDISFILATGGTNMVKAAYRSGTPSIGVGKGNAPVWICADTDADVVASQIVDSKSFDNGIVCGSENNLIVDAAVYTQVTQAFEAQGGAVLSKKEVLRLTDTLFRHGEVDGGWIGKSAHDICRAAGIHRPLPIRLLVVPVDDPDFKSPFLHEKLVPIVSLMSAASDDEALFLAQGVLSIEGRGHTAIIHTADQNRIERFAEACDVCRVLVNSPGTQGCIGACNGLELSWTLGCGTAGGSSTSDNVTYRHLQNTKRIAHADVRVYDSRIQA